MKPRRVIITIEADSSRPISFLRKATSVRLYNAGTGLIVEDVKIEQVQVNVVKAATTKRMKK